MNIEYFRLVSVDPQGIGNKGNGQIDLLYSSLLNLYGLNYYKSIKVNQIAPNQGIKEFVEIEKGFVHVNIIYIIDPRFDSLADFEKNKIRLEVIHAGLLRLAKEDDKFAKVKLERIRNEILENKFDFAIEVFKKENPVDNKFLSKLIIRPQSGYFDFFLQVINEGHRVCEIHLYKGKSTPFYVDSFFSKIIWVGINQLIIEGEEKQMRIIIDINECNVSFDNLTSYSKPPLWEMMRVGLTQEENNNAYENWLHSLPPAYSAIIRNSDN